MLTAVIAAWLAVGAISVAVMHRRGHDTFAWALPFLFLGPLAVPVALSADRHRPVEPERPLPPGGLDVLVHCDGSPASVAATDLVLSLLGDRATTLTLAAVVDFEAASTVRGRDTQRQAQLRLDEAARTVVERTATPVGTVVLFGESGEALQHYAAANGYELIVAGGHSWRRSPLGPRAAAGSHSVPVLVGPGVA